MKKFYMLVAASFVAATSFGQRNMDLELKLTNPANEATVAQSTSQALGFTVENVGDDLVVGDTVWLYVLNYTTGSLFALDGTPGGANYFLVDATTAPLFNTQVLNSTVLNGGTPLTFNTAAAGFNDGDTVAVVVDFGSVASNPGVETNFMNNFEYFFLDLSLSLKPLEGDGLSLIAFPNPASTQLTVMAKEEISSITITNLEGKVVLTSTSNKVNIAELTSGVYIYEVTTVTGLKAVKKFMKN